MKLLFVFVFLSSACFGQAQNDIGPSIADFVSGFYNSLELSEEQNQLAYELDTPFPKNSYKKYLSIAASIPLNRLAALTGEYHTYYNVNLEKIYSVHFKNDSSYTVAVLVTYFVYEVGRIKSEEEIDVVVNRGALEISGWYDISLSAFDEAGALGMELDPNENSLCEVLGGCNKRIFK